MIRLIIVSVFFFCAACTETVWVHAKKDQAQYGADRWDCEQMLAMRQSASVRVIGGFGFGSSGKPEDDDIDRCMILKQGWEKKEVAKGQKR